MRYLPYKNRILIRKQNNSSKWQHCIDYYIDVYNMNLDLYIYDKKSNNKKVINI